MRPDRPAGAGNGYLSAMLRRPPLPFGNPAAFPSTPSIPAFIAVFLSIAAAVFGKAPAPPSARQYGPALHIRLGPDSNACGITPAAGPAAESRRKPGLIVWLHGGMRSANREKGFEAHRALLPFVDPTAFHLCSPSAFGGQEWPTPAGMAHIDALIGYMESHYPVDTADILLVGVSDGNLGVIVYSLQGRYAVSRRVLISSAPQLVLPLESLPGRTRFAAGTWDFLQGGRDRLFPPDQVIPYLKQWENLYSNAHLHYFPEGEHDFSFYSDHAAELLRSLLSRRKPGPAPVHIPQKTQGIQNSPAGS